MHKKTLLTIFFTCFHESLHFQQHSFTEVHTTLEPVFSSQCFDVVIVNPLYILYGVIFVSLLCIQKIQTSDGSDSKSCSQHFCLRDQFTCMSDLHKLRHVFVDWIFNHFFYLFFIYFYMNTLVVKKNAIALWKIHYVKDTVYENMSYYPVQSCTVSYIVLRILTYFYLEKNMTFLVCYNFQV